MKNKGFELNLKSDAFNAFKSDFDSMLKHTLYTMEQKEGEVAQISISFKISLTKDSAPDTQITAYEATRDVIIPKIEHKLKSLIKIQDERAGYLGGEKYELVWDKDACEYVMREIKDGNPTLFDYIDDDEDGEPTSSPVEVDENDCESLADGSCSIVDDCGTCCRDCEEPQNCLNICEKYKARAEAITADAAPDLSEPAETGGDVE